MTKEQLLKKLGAAWIDFNESFAGLTEPRVLEPGVTGNWSVKDIIAHVTWWDEEAIKHLPIILKGVRPPRYSVKYGGIDAFNAMMTERKKDLSLVEVLHECDETHSRLIAYIKTLPEDQFTTETRVRRRIRLDCYSHYPIHAKAIRKWREQKGLAVDVQEAKAQRSLF
jgi:Protein of unknown function (DUF1706).